MSEFNIDSFALDLMRKVWEIGNGRGPDSQRKAQIQVAIAEAVGPLMTQQQAEQKRVTMEHMDALHKAIDHVASLQNDRLRYKSACEISGDKHPEYVRGYEAAMDVVCKAQQAGEPVEYQFYDPVTDRWHGFMNERHRIATEEAGYKIRALYTAPQAQPAPIPTAWQPIETAPTDVLHVRGVVVCSANGIPTHFECHAGYVDRDGDFIDTAGDWNGWSAEDYTHWHPLAGPPAPGGDA